MTATNHALTGAVIGLAVHNPLVAIIVAFLSHFVLDAIPHYDDPRRDLGSKWFLLYLIADGSFCVLLVGVLLISHVDGWFLASVCAFAATSPDLMWFTTFWGARNGKKVQWPSYPVARFHAWVQWFTRPIGGIVEAFWAAGMISILAKLV